MSNQLNIQGVSVPQHPEISSVDELASTVRAFGESGTPIIDYGRVHHGVGHRPPVKGIHIVPPTGIVDHYVADMTIRVLAGTPVESIQTALRSENQWLPIDGADPSVTIGELISHNVSGPLRLGFGSLRDLLLGLKYIDAAGREISVGGRTVKNVAGYDVTKLMVGSLGTLGLICEATLRTYAMPQHVSQIECRGLSLNDMRVSTTRLLSSDAAPIYWYWQVDRTGVSPVVSAHAGYAGSELGCSTQIAAMTAWIESSFKEQPEIRVSTGPLEQDTTGRLERRRWRDDVSGLVKVIVPPSLTATTMITFTENVAASFTADVESAHGVIWIGGDWTSSEAAEVDEKLNSIIEPLNGMRIWHGKPENSTSIAPFAPEQPDWPLFRRVKNAMDPNNLFNPGRYP